MAKDTCIMDYFVRNHNKGYSLTRHRPSKVAGFSRSQHVTTWHSHNRMREIGGMLIEELWQKVNGNGRWKLDMGEGEGETMGIVLFMDEQ